MRRTPYNQQPKPKIDDFGSVNGPNSGPNDNDDDAVYNQSALDNPRRRGGSGPNLRGQNRPMNNQARQQQMMRMQYQQQLARSQQQQQQQFDEEEEEEEYQPPKRDPKVIVPQRRKTPTKHQDENWDVEPSRKAPVKAKKQQQQYEEEEEAEYSDENQDANDEFLSQPKSSNKQQQQQYDENAPEDKPSNTTYTHISAEKSKKNQKAVVSKISSEIEGLKKIILDLREQIESLKYNQEMEKNTTVALQSSFESKLALAVSDVKSSICRFWVDVTNAAGGTELYKCLPSEIGSGGKLSSITKIPPGTPLLISRPFKKEQDSSGQNYYWAKNYSIGDRMSQDEHWVKMYSCDTKKYLLDNARFDKQYATLLQKQVDVNDDDDEDDDSLDNNEFLGSKSQVFQKTVKPSQTPTGNEQSAGSEQTKKIADKSPME